MLELDAQRIVTASMIMAFPSMINLRRTTMVDDGAGGVVASGSPASLGAVARWFQRVPTDDFERVVEKGDEVVSAAILVGLYTDDIKNNDEFDKDGHTWQVVFVHENTTYEVRAGCVTYA